VEAGMDAVGHTEIPCPVSCGVPHWVQVWVAVPTVGLVILDLAVGVVPVAAADSTAAVPEDPGRNLRQTFPRGSMLSTFALLHEKSSSSH
jgi:hypothetical protein